MLVFTLPLKKKADFEIQVCMVSLFKCGFYPGTPIPLTPVDETYILQ